MNDKEAAIAEGTLRIVRRFLAIAFLAGGIGTGIELVLLEHTEDFWQWTPLVLIGLGAVAFAVVGIRPSRPTIRMTQALMVLVVTSSLLGIYFHLKGNVEFEKEMYPSMAGVELMWESLKGATPSLAPGAMALLGAIGLIFCYRHPALHRSD